MKTDKFYFYSMAAILTVLPFIVGGYYVFVCSAVNIVLIVLFLIGLFRNKSFKLSISFETAVIGLMTLLYLITSLWAVDKTMSPYGFIKLLVPFLFMLNLFQIKSEDRKSLLFFVPYSAGIMVAGSYLLSFIKPMKALFFDDIGNFHGTFQYANAFAIYLLIALIIAIYKPKTKKISVAADIVCALLSIFGIALSGSRIVVALTVFILICIVVLFIFEKIQQRKKKTVFICVIAAVFTIGAIAFSLSPLGSEIIEKVMSDKSFVKRTVYYYDAFVFALKYPFGKGTYAFYYVQPTIQSANYYVIDVHNDYLQMMVEIGIIPCLLFVAVLAKQLISNKIDLMQKLIIIALGAHCFFDYDLQFASLFLILLLCFDFGNEKEFESKSKLIPIVVFAALIIFNSLLGLSSYFNHSGNQEKSNYYHKNTSATLMLMQNSNDQQFGYDCATQLLKNNNYIFEANRVLSSIYFENERYAEAIEQMEQVLNKEPRNMKNYEKYIDICIVAEQDYLKNNNTEKAKECAQKIAGIDDTLKELKKNTNKRAILYTKNQKFKVDKEHIDIIRKYEKALKSY